MKYVLFAATCLFMLGAIHGTAWLFGMTPDRAAIGFFIGWLSYQSAAEACDDS